MKKLAMTIAIVLGLSLSTFANPNDGGLFQRGAASEPAATELYGIRAEGNPRLPNHGLADNQDAPLGSGIVLLTALGAGYVMAKRRREE